MLAPLDRDAQFYYCVASLTGKIGKQVKTEYSGGAVRFGD